MSGFEIILEKVTILGILTMIGFVFFKLRWLTQEVKTGLQKLIFNLTLPLLIFITISKFQFTAELAQNGITVFLMSYLFLAMQYFLGWATSKIFRLPENTKIVHILHTTFGNVVFLGYPSIDALFPGTPALFYAAVYHFAQTSVIWTIGIYQLDSNKSTGLLSNLNKLINPNTIAFMVGMIFMAMQIRLPEAVTITFRGLGSSTLYISMVYIGLLLADFKPKMRDFSMDLIMLTINKLIIIPVAVLFITLFLTSWFGLKISFPALGALVLQSAMPCMAILVILAKNYGADHNAAMINVFTTTLLSLITLPFIFWLVFQFHTA